MGVEGPLAAAGQVLYVVSEPNQDECGALMWTHTNMGIDLGHIENVTFFESGWIVTSRFVVYVEGLKGIDLTTYITKMHLPFWSHIRLELQD